MLIIFYLLLMVMFLFLLDAITSKLYMLLNSLTGINDAIVCHQVYPASLNHLFLFIVVYVIYMSRGVLAYITVYSSLHINREPIYCGVLTVKKFIKHSCEYI